ncbi:sigma-70 family RNA polymerase sigma factor [Gottfriedia luciferensis]|uniref:sigma-70 family RNA polymerase sigma factor n=1 Tax=Gottfriedia luciferensis TaxID=178774 RepID=UPI000B4478EA|nr:sigma-70 family RNA polymerase sigma factor [Gottfriedia luciferensis]
MDSNQKKVSMYLDNLEKSKRFIIEKFLEDQNNLILFESYLEQPDLEKQKLIDTSFKKFLFEFRKKSFFKSLIRFKSIDFDKHLNKHNKRNILTLDSPINSTTKNNLTNKELIVSETTTFYSKLDPFEEIDNDQLKKAIKTLTSKQRLIIKLIYFYNFTQTEVALLIDTSPQNVNKIHKKAIEQIKSKFKYE